jgi:hypothetical protein
MTDRMAEEKGYIDVSFVNLTEKRARELRILNILRAIMVCTIGLAGFLFFPFMILFLSGEDITVNMAESIADGFYWLPAFHVVLNTLMGIVAGFIGIALFPRLDE